MTKWICPICKGTKEAIIPYLNSARYQNVAVLCPHCQGDGKVTSKEAYAVNREIARWCSCSYESDKYLVYENMFTSIPYKHWRCSACDLIVIDGFEVK